MKNLLAGGYERQDITNPLFKGSSFEGLQQIMSVDPGTVLSTLLPNIIGLLLVFGTVAFFFMILIGAISWITSGGDKAKIESARGRITSALIGVVLMISTFAIVGLIEYFFDINILTIDIGPLVIQ